MRVCERCGAEAGRIVHRHNRRRSAMYSTRIAVCRTSQGLLCRSCQARRVKPWEAWRALSALRRQERERQAHREQRTRLERLGQRVLPGLYT